MKNTSYISIGSNLGNRNDNIDSAIKLIVLDPSIEILNTSPKYETDPLPTTADQNRYLNCVLEISTDFDPKTLLNFLNEIEVSLGRPENHDRWSERTIDLDIVFFNDEIIDEPDLKIPHHGAAKRIFVLKPICDISPSLVHPTLDKTVKELLDEIILSGNTLSIKRKAD